MALIKRGPVKGEDVAPSKLEPLRKMYLDARRRLKPDPLPLEPPVGYKRSPTLAEQIRSMVRGEALAHAARMSGQETFEEADDFEVEDDFDPRAPYEEVFDPPPTWEEKAAQLGEFIERGKRRYLEKVEEEERRKDNREKKLKERAEKGEDTDTGEKAEEGT